ncbi:MAG: 2-amino-4-hydroxy-6-hydroxymethyldihydropteridine diphosphokinase [Bacilli bacterium]
MGSSTYYISLGSNLGDREQFLRQALGKLALAAGTSILTVSDVFETEPVDFEKQPKFLNAVAKVRSDMGALDMLRTLVETERTLGRVRGVRFGPRTIDLDLLLCDELEINLGAELIVPHPRMHERAFVLVPLAQIAPTLTHPFLCVTMRELCDRVRGKEGVKWTPIYLRDACAPTED